MGTESTEESGRILPCAVIHLDVRFPRRSRGTARRLIDTRLKWSIDHLTSADCHDRWWNQCFAATASGIADWFVIKDPVLFRGELETALERSDRSKGGRPPYDAVLMFRVLVLQTLYTLSDDATEYQLKDRLSFMRFCAWRCTIRCPTPRRSGSIANS